MAECVGPLGGTTTIILFTQWIEIAIALLNTELDGLIGIAFAGGETVTQACDQDISDLRGNRDRLLTYDVDRNVGALGIGQSDCRPADPFATAGGCHQLTADPPF